MNEKVLKFSLIFAGGFLLFWALKPKASAKTTEQPPTSPIKEFDAAAVPKSTVTPTMENAEIVATAYTEAMKAGESPSRLTELNKECMKDFGMRCYVKDDKLIVCDVSGNVMLTK